MDFAAWIPAVISLISLLGTGLSLRAQRKKDEASAADTLSDAALRIVESERKERERLQRRVSRLQLSVITQGRTINRIYVIKDLLVSIIDQLTAQVKAAGLTPVAIVSEEIRNWKPDFDMPENGDEALA